MGGATNLLSEIDRFLSVGVYSSRTEGLRALGTLLHKSRFEISSLIEKGNEYFFADCAFLITLHIQVAMVIQPYYVWYRACSLSAVDQSVPEG